MAKPSRAKSEKPTETVYIDVTDHGRLEALGAIVRHHVLNGYATAPQLQAACNIPAFRRDAGSENETKESSRTVTRLITHASSQYANNIAKHFRKKVLTSAYCNALPLYVLHAVHQAFPDMAHDGFDKTRIEKSKTRTSPLMFINRFAVYDEKMIADLVQQFVGLWHVIRYAHRGTRVVHAVLEIVRPDEATTMHPFPTFKIFFRTRASTGKHDIPPYVTDGCLVPLRSPQHMMFLGVEDTEHPLTIASKIRTLPRGVIPDRFDGIVQRHHVDDNVFFSMPVAFARAKPMPIDKYSPQNIGSWPEAEAMKAFTKEVPDIAEILERLRRRRAGDGRAGLIASPTD